MRTIDCAVLHEWEYDDDFVSILSSKLSSVDISNEIVHAKDFSALFAAVKRDEIFFKSVIDRASDVDEVCDRIVKALLGRGSYVVNNPTEITHASDKASMHLEFITAGIFVPYTIIISPYSAEREVKLSLAELAKLGRPFIIKPANTTGGGVGVVTGAEGLQEVVDTRQHNKNDKYLLQSRVEPVNLEGKRAWFRPFFVFGDVIVCWWDDKSHIYLEATEKELNDYGLGEIARIVRKIHEVSRLDFFSTEIALNDEGKFIVIDYVNEMCDMRLKSKHFDGVPDHAVEAVAARLAFGIQNLLKAGK